MTEIQMTKTVLKIEISNWFRVSDFVLRNFAFKLFLPIPFAFQRVRKVEVSK
jgi:hypothetical protein